MTNAQKYENTLMSLHTMEVIGLNPEYREGLSTAHSKIHDQWCKDNPNATREERKIAYRSSYDAIRDLYPSVKELQG